MSKRKQRRLSPEEEALWNRVAGTATPLAGRPAPPKPSAKIAAKPSVPPPAAADPIPPFSIGMKSATALPAHDLVPDMSERLDAQPLKMDKKQYQRMKRGRADPEARIDLHGMTVGAAEGALRSFIYSAHGAGRRLVLVITGKGRTVRNDDPIPTRTGILRHQVPVWLSRPPLGPLVLQVTEAHQRHGGSGALYVYLRRR